MAERMKLSKAGIDPGVILNLVKILWKSVSPWLKEKAKESSNPLDDWLVNLIDDLLSD